jgi:hypothetical protein
MCRQPRPSSISSWPRDNPEGYTLYTYAAIQAFAAAAGKPRSLKVDDLSKALK